MTKRQYAIIEQCFEKGFSEHQCFDVISEEYSMSQIPTLGTIRKVYHECKEVYDRF